MRYAIGMDVGGTSAKLGLVAISAGSAEILLSDSVSTGYETPRERLLSGFRAAVARLAAYGLKNRTVPEALGVGMPGFQDAEGRVVEASNLPQLNGVAVASLLGAEFGLPALLDNDLNVAALGEYLYGGHGAVGRLLVVALGTGVGAAMVVDGEVLRPTHGGLGDPGHILVDPGGRPCRCGARGCLEAVISGWAIAEQGGVADPAEVFASQEPASLALVVRIAGWLGMGLASYCVLYEPDCIVLGGRVGRAGGESFLAQVEARMKQAAQPRFRDVRLRPSTLEDKAGVLGAAAMVPTAGAAGYSRSPTSG